MPGLQKRGVGGVWTAGWAISGRVRSMTFLAHAVADPMLSQSVAGANHGSWT